MKRPPVLWLSRLLALAGAVALGWCAFVLVQNRTYQREAARKLESAAPPAPRAATAEPAGGPSEGPPCEEPPEPVRPAAGTPLARLEIPRVGLSAIIAEGIDPDILRLAIGHVPGTAFPGEEGNVALAAHRDTFFRNLERLRPNDAIRLSTPGHMDCYVVDSFEVVLPEDARALAPSVGALTLITCYPFRFVGPAPRRFIVHAHRDNA